jgi:hypothetical protein
MNQIEYYQAICIHTREHEGGGGGGPLQGGPFCDIASPSKKKDIETTTSEDRNPPVGE